MSKIALVVLMGKKLRKCFFLESLPPSRDKSLCVTVYKFKKTEKLYSVYYSLYYSSSKYILI